MVAPVDPSRMPSHGSLQAVPLTNHPPCKFGAKRSSIVAMAKCMKIKAVDKCQRSGERRRGIPSKFDGEAAVVIETATVDSNLGSKRLFDELLLVYC
jgi:hypothetical protein